MIKSILRIAVVAALSIIGMIFLFSVEQEKDTAAFMLHVILDKTFAVGMFALAAVLYKHWATIDAWFIAYKKLCQDDID